MTRAAFEQLVDAILLTLPAEYAGRLHNLVFIVEDWADAELLAELGFDDPAELLGFFSGTPLSERSFDQIAHGPELITLYQGAIEKETAASGLPLGQVVRETLWHEIAHYFGFSEEEMDRIEDFWAGEG
ncbi:MAG TPA: metallopeptidase family protein [Geothermobacteraceae bacterium]|nr:metallopeptidase family protein [Geothermobacteraceae bacterium]